MNSLLVDHSYQLILSALFVVAVYLLFALRRKRGVNEDALVRILPEIRDGSLPIDELLNIKGPLEPVARQIHEIVRDLRQQRASVARLEMEIQQRIANKTDALQRTIGSLRLQASRDAVTGLFNRRMLDQILPDVTDRLRATGSDLTVLMIDLDYFKEVNDTLGHAAGDQLLITVSQIIRSGIRDSDMAFRYGGDEFVVLLPATDRAAAETMANRLAALVDTHAKTLHLQYPPALSIGIACTRDLDNSSATHLLRHADEELYKIKQQRHPGRRRDAA